MRSFLSFLSEEYLFERDTKKAKDSPKLNAPKEEGEKKGPANYWLGAAYESKTMMNLHDASGAKDSKDPAQAARYAEAKRLHKEALSKLSPEDQKKAIEGADRSSDAYLDDLKKQGIKASDIEQVHHTYAGIDDVVGEKTDQQDNPHDVAIVTKKGQIHGASLKLTSGTLTNNTTNSVDEMSSKLGISTNVDAIWKKKMIALGLADKNGKPLSEKQLRVARSADPENDPRGKNLRPEVQQAYYDTQRESAAHHADSFNKATPEQRKAYMLKLMKANPHEKAPYSYVRGDVGTSEDIRTKKHYVLAKKAKDFKAEISGPNEKNPGQVRIVDHEGNNIVNFDHRSTHGAFLSNQVNGKFGTAAPKKPAKDGATPRPAKTASQPTNKPKPAKPPTTAQVIKKQAAAKARNPTVSKSKQMSTRAATITNVAKPPKPQQPTQPTPPPRPAPQAPAPAPKPTGAPKPAAAPTAAPAAAWTQMPPPGVKAAHRMRPKPMLG
ncbi:hypothetical protein UFOVP132_203 [uncultured Caudovirales phage]|uniref:Uncharacterized protein n=1 Tax=uncultured Caudovirales phage TaxID=2100421 RepID=A0A6J5LDP8_9CAUD|nr:hypothetical protein UFOVP132_203 [uncultured Caudovirales phage]